MRTNYVTPWMPLQLSDSSLQLQLAFVAGFISSFRKREVLRLLLSLVLKKNSTSHQQLDLRNL